MIAPLPPPLLIKTWLTKILLPNNHPVSGLLKNVNYFKMCVTVWASNAAIFVQIKNKLTQT